MILLFISLFSTLYTSQQPCYSLFLFTIWYSSTTDLINSPKGIIRKFYLFIVVFPERRRIPRARSRPRPGRTRWTATAAARSVHPGPAAEKSDSLVSVSILVNFKNFVLKKKKEFPVHLGPARRLNEWFISVSVNAKFWVFRDERPSMRNFFQFQKSFVFQVERTIH